MKIHLIMKYCFLGLLILLLASCKGAKNREQLTVLLKEWEQREILFPSHAVFTVRGKDTVGFLRKSQYKVLVYTDSVGCTGCRMRLADWKKFMCQVDSTCTDSVQFLFFFFPKKGTGLYQTLRMSSFDNPVCIDEQDSLNLLNRFPKRMDFQTFLLNEDNKVVAVGNPVYNGKVRDLYLQILSDDKFSGNNDDRRQTSLRITPPVLDMGVFPWKERQARSLNIRNTGNGPLVINDVTTSCGCITADYPKEPILPGEDGTLYISYQAEQPEYFDKTISVYCNVGISPVIVRLRGNAENKI